MVVLNVFRDSNDSSSGSAIASRNERKEKATDTSHLIYY